MAEQKKIDEEYDGVSWDAYDEDDEPEPAENNDSNNNNENNNNIINELKEEEFEDNIEDSLNYTPKNTDYYSNRNYFYKSNKYDYNHYNTSYRSGYVNKSYKNYNNNSGRFSKNNYGRNGYFNGYTKYNSTLNPSFGRKDFKKKSFYKNNYNYPSYKNSGIIQKEFEIDDTDIQNDKKLPIKNEFIEIDDGSYSFNTIDINNNKRDFDFFEKNNHPRKNLNKEKNYINKNNFFSEKYKKRENLKEFKEVKDFRDTGKEIEKNKTFEEGELELQKPIFYNSKKDNKQPERKEEAKSNIPTLPKEKYLYINDFINLENLDLNIKNIGNEIIKILKEKMENSLEKEYGSLNIKAEIYEPTKNRIRREILNNYYELPMMGNDNRMQYNMNMNHF